MFHPGQFLHSHRSWCLFCIMAAASLISNFQQIGLAAVSGSVAESLQIDSLGLGLLTAAFSYAYAAMQIPAGILADTLGARKSVTGALLLATGGTILFACSTSLQMAVIARLLMGFSLAVVFVPQLKLIAVWFPVSAYPRLAAIAFAICAVGLLLATSPMAYAVAAIGWRASFAIVGILTLVAGLLIWIIVRDRPSRNELLALSADEGDDPSAGPAPGIPSKLLSIMKTKETWMLGLWLFCQSGVYFAFVGLWGGQYLTRGLGLSPEESGWILSLAACALMAAPFLTWLSEKLRSMRKTLILLSSGSVVMLLPMVLGLPKMPSFVLTLYFFLFSVLLFGGGVLIFAEAKEHFPLELAGSVSGIMNMFPFFGGAILQQLVGLAVNTLHGAGLSYETAISRSFAVLLVFSALSLLLIFHYSEVNSEPRPESGA